jgi:hypothetical protein
MDKPWFFPKGTCKRTDQDTACVGLQEGGREHGGLFNIVSPARNFDVHCRHARARGLPPGEQPWTVGCIRQQVPL